MNLGSGIMGSMPLPGSSFMQKPAGTGTGADVVSDQFPVGLRVLVVDDDRICLTILEKMLRTCRYEVTKTNRAEDALFMLRENKNGFDIVISDVHMPDMDGFKLLECVGIEMDLPVIMMSADDSKNVVMKGVIHGACDYLIKPVRIEALKNIWQHVVRKKKNEWKEIEQSGSWEEGDRLQKQTYTDQSSPANEGNWKSSKRKCEAEEDDTEAKDDSATLKKPRVVWSVELHQQFVAAVNQLGIDKAVPKKILELMNVPGLTRENVASHLQKYRLYLRRLSGVSQHPGGLNNSFMGPQDPSFGAMSSLSSIDLQTLAATGQLSAQTLAAYQGGLARPPMKPGMVPFIDHRSLFSFENAKLRFGEAQPQDPLSSKQMNLLHGVPTTMEPKQLAGLHQSTQSLGSMNIPGNAPPRNQSSSLLMQMVQPQQSRGQILNESTGHQVSRIQSSMVQPMPSNGSSGRGLSKNGMSVNGQRMTYNPVSQTSSVVDFSVNHVADLPGNGFPLGSTPGITSHTSKGYSQEENSSEVKEPRSFPPSYDIFSDLQQKPQDWQLHNAGLTFGAASQQPVSVQNSVSVSPSVLVNHSFSSGQSSEHNDNGISGKPIFSAGPVRSRGSMPNISQSRSGLLADSSSRVKTEGITDVAAGANPFSEQYGQDDLMSALLKQSWS